MKYIWQVIEQGTEPTGDSKYPELPESQCGIVETFVEALKALSAWQGAETDPPHRLYQIIPMHEFSEAN